jgi:hypothetical protein
LLLFILTESWFLPGGIATAEKKHKYPQVSFCEGGLAVSQGLIPQYFIECEYQLRIPYNQPSVTCPTFNRMT